MIRPTLFLALFVSLLAACSSGRSALKRGDFDLAVKRASQRLTQRAGLSKRGHATAPLVLKQAFEQAYQQHQSAIRRLSTPSSATPFRWELIYQEYEKLQTLTDNARRGLGQCVACAEWLATYPASYLERQQDTRALAAADRYEAADQAFAYRKENRLAAKDAYLNYRKAIDWVPDYQQARAKADEALNFALLRVMVEPISLSPELSPNDNLKLQALIMQRITPDEAPSTFVRLYPLYEIGADGQTSAGWPIHQTVQMVVTNYTPYRENKSSSSTTVYSNQAYKVGEKKINDSTKVDIMEKVKGTLTTYRHDISASLALSMRAIDTQTGTVLWEEPVWENRSWFTEWETFSGDDRALNGQTLKSANLFPPSSWSLYASMRDELAGDVVRRIRRKYAND